MGLVYLNNPNNRNSPNNPMFIGGLQKFSLLDYPGQVSAIIFTQGCNFRCQFCYNPMLVWPAFAKDTAGKPAYTNEVAVGMPIAVSGAEVKAGKLKYQLPVTGREQKGYPCYNKDDLFVFLRSRQGKLDAVVITGGEPTIQPDLPDFMRRVKKLGFLIKLDTNGANPAALKRLIDGKLVDYLAMDIKAPRHKYPAVAGVKLDFPKIKKSATMIMGSGLPYEFRTTIVPELLDKKDIEQMGRLIKGANKWYLQKFKSGTELVNRAFEGRRAYTDKEMADLAEIGRRHVKVCEAR